MCVWWRGDKSPPIRRWIVKWCCQYHVAIFTEKRPYYPIDRRPKWAIIFLEMVRKNFWSFHELNRSYSAFSSLNYLARYFGKFLKLKLLQTQRKNFWVSSTLIIDQMPLSYILINDSHDEIRPSAKNIYGHLVHMKWVIIIIIIKLLLILWSMKIKHIY